MIRVMMQYDIRELIMMVVMQRMEIVLIVMGIALLVETASLLRIRRMKRTETTGKKPIDDKQTEPQSMQVGETKSETETFLQSIENGEFKMFLQFVVDSKTQNISMAEALSRWAHPEKGILGPGAYIGAMESLGLISKLDYYMFELACRQLAQWNGTAHGNISISCNFTRATLSEPDCAEKLKEISDRYHFTKSLLAIEITEDTIEKDREIAQRNIRLCKEYGFRIYLDDLGSGYTSLSNLCDYPIDVVKIDRDILLKADTSRGKELLTGIIALAHHLKLSAICEGVETEEQNTLVSQADCDYIQGWYYAKAMPAEEWESFINVYHENQKKEGE